MARRPTQKQIYEQLLDRYSREMADAFLSAIQAAAGQIDLAALASAIDAGDLARAVQIIGFDETALFPVADAVWNAFVAGGASAATIAPRGAIFGFNGRHERAEAWVAREAGRMIQGITDDTLPMVRAVVQDGLARGRGGAAVARDITGRLNRATGRREGGFIGLTTQQADAAIRARAILSSGDASAIRAYLNEKKGTKVWPARYNDMIRRAIDEGKPLSQTDIDKITGRYRDRMAKYRGEVIAGTEAAQAAAAGQREGFQQALDSGRVSSVTKRWQHNSANQDEREDHVYMGFQPAIPFDRLFTLPDGTQMEGPHDPAGGAGHNIGCRCIAIYRVTV